MPSLTQSIETGPETWIPEIHTLHDHLDKDDIESSYGTFAILDGIYETIGKYVPYPDTTDPEYANRRSRRENSRSASCVFDFQHTGRENTSEWFKEVNDLKVSYDTRWDPKYNVDDDTDLSSAADSPREARYVGDTPKYVIGGLLVEPLVTGNADRAAQHIAAELPKLAERCQYITELEQLTPRSKFQDSPNTERCHSPVNVKGVGSKTVKTLTKTFGVYSNILPYGVQGAKQFTSQSWGTWPENDRLYERVQDATSRYYQRLRDGSTHASIEPADLFEYPKQQPGGVMRRGGHHHIAGQRD